MISKIKKPVSILLSLIMVFSMFTIVPFSASAAVGDVLSEDEYLTFTAEEAGATVTLNVLSGSNFQYDLNGAGLTDYTAGTQITLANASDYVRFSGTGTKFNSSNHVVITGKVACSGNVMSLRLNGGKVQSLEDYCFDSMFYRCTGLTSAPELPETELKNYCYRNMFYRCENLTKAPELPATNLANGCYSNMFYYCKSLTKAPELPATNLADFCYYYMFYGCTSLTEAPELPATNLADSCYYGMFSGCTSLTKAPALPATNLAESCYSNMFYGCKSLTELPALPATTLARTCYKYMFSGCSKICISDQAGTFGDITYSAEYRIPTTGEGTSAYDALTNMFGNTGGKFKGTPDINTTYYVPAPAPETFKVYVKKLTGETYTIENLTGETTVAQLKEIIADQIDIPATAQRLIFAGKQLEDAKTLAEYNIVEESTIHLVIRGYTVTWLNYDNSELGTTTVQYGATPSYDGETPTRAEDADYTYTFYGWSDGTTTYGPTDTLPAVTGEVTYTAVFDATPLHVHNVVHVEEVPAGCTEPGRKAYYCCDDESCELYGRFFEDEELSVELTDLTIPALGHDYAAVVTEPSCTEGGYTTHTCSRCGDSYVDDLTDALGHDWGDWAVTAEPSCTEDGEETRTCARCNETETHTLDALGHNPGDPVIENYVEPTGSEEGGYDTAVYCQRCGAELSREHTTLSSLDGPNADGHFYLNGEIVPCYQFVEWNGDWYFINDDDMYARDIHLDFKPIYVEGTPFEPGCYYFDAMGRLVIQNGPKDNGYFYLNGIRQKAYQVLEYEGSWYFITDGNKYAVSSRRYLNQQLLANTPFSAGYYEFDENGRMVLKNGPQDDGYFYLDGIKQKAYQLIEWNGDYYFINDAHKYARNIRLYLGQQFVEGSELAPGYYDFDETGKLVIKNGPWEDGYFYLNGARQSCYQLIRWEGGYYFINDGHKYAVNKRIYLSAKYIGDEPISVGYHYFGEDGRMIQD